MSAKEEDVFTEEQTPHVHLSLRVRQWLERKRTAYQDLVVAETVELGRLLALDGKVMLTEADEAFYHEMLVHPPLLTLPAPETVAVIGGGDGGTVREVLRHPCVRRVFWVEIDGEVVEACRRWLPSVFDGVLEDERVSLHIAPGQQWLADMDNALDVILVDGTDPIGLALPLFEPPFFRACRRALKPQGILALQCGTPFYFRDEVRMVARHLRRVFARFRLYLGFVPTYPSGLWAYALAGDSLFLPDLATLRQRQRERRLHPCRYYTPEVHRASFALPPFVEELLVET